MQLYEGTSLAKEIAQDSGLEDMVSRMVEADFLDPLVYQLADDLAFNIKDPEEIEKEAVDKALERLKTPVEADLLMRGLHIDPDVDRWRSFGQLQEGTLFPIVGIADFKPATDTDRFVVSGVAGLQLLNYRNSCRLLARNGFEVYGFDNFVDSCAFVGAYVVGRLSSNESKYDFNRSPSFTYTKNGVTNKVSVGGTMHGDFTISSTRWMESDIISPTSRPSEYGPRDNIFVSGYHSIELDILESLIVSEYIRAGKTGAQALVAEMFSTISELVSRDNGLKYSPGPFTVFGERDVVFEASRIRMLLDDESFVEAFKRLGSLHSSRYLPQSDVMFQILHTEEGVVFQNGYEVNTAPQKGIEVDREHFGDLFQALLLQTQKGLGRTSPGELVDLVCYIKDILTAQD